MGDNPVLGRNCGKSVFSFLKIRNVRIFIFENPEFPYFRAFPSPHPSGRATEQDCASAGDVRFLVFGPYMYHSQVFTDFYPQRTDEDGAYDSEGLSMLGARIQEFMVNYGSSGGGGGKKQSTPNFKKQLQANEERVKGLDHTMQLGLGWGLARLRPSRRPGPLPPGWSRFYVDSKELPPEIAEDQPDRDRRCFLAGPEGGDQDDAFLEVVNDSCRTIVVNWADQGGAEWPSKLWLNYGLGLRFQEFPDIWHRRDNNVKLAFSRAGLNSIKVEMTICLNGLQGPWSDNGNFGKVAACAEQYFKNNTFECPIFRAVYDWIALDRNQGKRLVGFGSEEHIRATWDELASCPIIVKKLDQVKLGRWHNWTLKMWRVSEHGSTLLLLLLVLGMMEKWYKDIYDSPLSGAPTTRVESEEGCSRETPC